MTKQELTNGKLFSVDSSTTKYKLTTSKGSEFYIVSRLTYSSVSDKLLFSDYEANVDKIGNKYFTFYNYVLGKLVTGKINFLEL